MEQLLVRYRLDIAPSHLQFQGREQLSVRINEVDEIQVAAWIDDLIVDFVETYLRLEHADPYQTRNLVIDPVCGMVINKNLAAARCDRLGQPYYFCVEGCHKKFLEDPQRYLAVAKTKHAAKRGCHAEENCTNA